MPSSFAVRSRAVLTAVALALALLGAFTATAAAQVNLTHTDRYFSPNGDGQEDTSWRSHFHVGQPATVSVVVRNAAGTAVRTLMNDVFVPAGQWRSFDWDGVTAAGTTAADGQYRFTVRAEEDSGVVHTATGLWGVDSGVPGSISRPVHGATIRGSAVRAAVVPRTGVDVTEVVFYGGQCRDRWWYGWWHCELDRTSTPTGTEGFARDLDSNLLRNGANELRARIVFNDPFLQPHEHHVGVPVTVANPVELTVSTTPRYFTPNGDGDGDVLSVDYRTTRDASVSARVLTDDGSPVRELRAAADQIEGWHSVGWDGRDGAGETAAYVPNGRYRVEISAVDADGGTVTRELVVGVERRRVAEVLTPAAGSTASGTTRYALAPVLREQIRSVDWYGVDASCWWCQVGHVTSAGASGDWGVDVDTTAFPDGPRTLYVAVRWEDPLGHLHDLWIHQAFSVSNPLRVDRPSSRVDFTPNGDGLEDEGWLSYQLSRDATVDVTITRTDEAGVESVVRRLKDDEPQTQHHQAASWDGRDASGELVPDGDYRWEVVATAGGETATAAGAFGVDKRVPGAITVPTEDQSVEQGSTRIDFTPAPGVEVQAVYHHLHHESTSVYLGHAERAADSDLFRLTPDDSWWPLGEQHVESHVQYVDRFGTVHTGRTVRRFRLTNGMAIRHLSGGERAFTPDADGHEDTATIRADLNRAAELTAVVRTDAGELVRTLADREPRGAGWTSVSWDGRSSAAADAPLVADGLYRIELRADAGDGTADARTTRVEVRTASLGTLALPAEGDVLSHIANVSYRPGVGAPLSSVRFCLRWWHCSETSGPSGDGSWRNSLETRALPDGDDTLTVDARWLDAFGVEHTQTLRRAVRIDNTGPVVSFVASPNVGGAPLDTRLQLDASAPGGGAMSYEVSFGDGSPVVTGTGTSPLDVAIPHRYGSAGSFRPQVLVSAGGRTVRRSEAVEVTGRANADPTATLAVAPASTTVGGDPVRATIGGDDPDGDDLTYAVDWGDGSTIERGTLPRATPLSHAYARSGSFLVVLEVSDGTTSTLRRQRVHVTLGGPLVAHAGDDVVVTLGQPARLSGASSTPQGIESYAWEFGDGRSRTAPDAVVEHTYAAAGEYTARLTVVAGGATSPPDTVRVRVVPPAPEEGLDVQVTDGAPVDRADVLVVDGDGTRHAAVTGPDGRARIAGLPDGDYTVYGHADGHKPGTAEARITARRGSATLELERGEVVAGEMSSRPMTIDEIEAAGIDVDDPANQHVFEFEIHLAFRGDGAGGSWPQPFAGCVNDEGTIYLDCDGSGTPAHVCAGECAFSIGGGWEAVPVPHVLQTAHGPVPVIQYMVIPGRAKFLKQFFQVSLVVQNLAPARFAFTDGEARISLPAGLSLAPTATPQEGVQAMPDIPGGQAQSATWVVRGDVEGEHLPTVDYSGVLDPLGKPVAFHGRLLRPMKVWGGSALRMVVEADDGADAGRPYHVRIGLENVADVPVYNPTVELLKEGRRGFIYQPREELEQGTAVVHPGGTFWTRDYILVPQVAGRLDLAHSFVKKTGGDVSLDSEIRARSVTRTVPALRTESLPDGVRLRWDPVPGATEYAVFRTPDADVDFPAEPLGTVAADASTPAEFTAEDVDPASPAQFYAVSALVEGHPVMAHRLVAERAGATVAYPSTSLEALAPCGASIAVRMDFAAGSGRLAAYRLRTGSSTAWTQVAITGAPSTHTATRTVTVPSTGTRIEVQAQDTTGTWGPSQTRNLQPCRFPSVSVSDVRLMEGDSGTQEAVFTVALSETRSAATTFKAATASSTATAGADFTAVPTTQFTIPGGSRSLAVRVPVVGDRRSEGDETFLLKLSSPTTGVTLADATATATVVDDEAPLLVTVDDAGTPEGGPETPGAARFAVELSRAPEAGQTVSLTYATANGSATTAGSDYAAARGTLTFTAGETREEVEVAAVGDTTQEASETFSLNLAGTNKGVVLADKQAIATIVNDDGAPGAAHKPQIYVGDRFLREGDAEVRDVTFELRLSASQPSPVTVKVATANGTAVSTEDFSAVALRTVTFPAGTTRLDVPVGVRGDLRHEPAETFVLKLSTPSANATIGDTAATAFLVDEEGPLVASIGEAVDDEGSAAAPGSLRFVVRLQQPPSAGESLTLGYATASKTAVAGTDFASASGTVTFAAGETAKAFDVAAIGDADWEPNETLVASVRSTSKSVVFADASGIGTLTNDD